MEPEHPFSSDNTIFLNVENISFILFLSITNIESLLNNWDKNEFIISEIFSLLLLCGSLCLCFRSFLFE